MKISQFTFNSFSENTYVLSDENGECVIIDPGMSDEYEDRLLFDFIEEEKLRPIVLLNTHCHIDHVLGNYSVCKKYGIDFWAHELEMSVLEKAAVTSSLWNLAYKESPLPNKFIGEGDQIRFGNVVLEILFVPGHAPGHIAFVNYQEKVVIGGDVLFKGSVGRVDFPGCNAKDLVDSIQKKMYVLGDDFTVHPGHGPETTIGEEKENNVFVRKDWSGL